MNLSGYLPEKGRTCVACAPSRQGVERLSGKAWDGALLAAWKEIEYVLSAVPDARTSCSTGKASFRPNRWQTGAPVTPTHYMQVFFKRVAEYGDRTALRAREDGTWRDMSWRTFGERVKAAAGGLISEGVGEQRMAGIWSQNRPEWSVADLGCQAARVVSVPVYATSTGKQAETVLNHAEAEILFVDGWERLEKARPLLASVPSLRKIAVFDGRLPRGEDEARVVSFEAFLREGRKAQHGRTLEERGRRAGPEDLLTVIYTSGTTGNPKGVVLTQSNLLFQLQAHDRRLPRCGGRDVSLCFLPLSHVFERLWTYYVFYRGMVNSYLEDPRRIAEAIREVRPTIMCAVPRFYEKIHAAVLQKLETAPPARRRLFHWAMETGRAYHLRKRDKRFIPPGLWIQYQAADGLVLSKLRAVLGGRARFFPCAGAPLPREIDAFFHAAGVSITCGYGLTETTATVTCREANGFKLGAVGKPLPGVDVKIDKATGEILVRGGNVMKGYHKDPEATARAFTPDGFFRTGDAGTFEDNGELLITDRIKDLIKTSGGKYVAPQSIETRLGADPFIEQVALVGDGKKCITALVVPAFEALETFAEGRGIVVRSREELVSRPEIKAFYRARIESLTEDLAPHEKIRRFTLLPREFELVSGEMTPTLKLKRKVILERHREAIEAMYADLEDKPGLEQR